MMNLPLSASPRGAAEIFGIPAEIPLGYSAARFSCIVQEAACGRSRGVRVFASAHEVLGEKP